MKRCIHLGVLLTMGILLASAPSLAGRWDDGGKKKIHMKSLGKTKKKRSPVDPSVPEPTGVLVFAAGMLAVQRATRRR
jgi:hypothetical protein